jgi:hypothetical protein
MDLQRSTARKNVPTLVGPLSVMGWLVASNTGTVTEAIYGKLKHNPKG